MVEPGRQLRFVSREGARRAVARLLIAIFAFPLPAPALDRPVPAGVAHPTRAGVPSLRQPSLPTLQPTSPPTSPPTSRPAIARAAVRFNAADPAPSSCRDTLVSGAFPTASVTRGELWPPDHALLDVGLRVDVGEACRASASTRVAVYSDEPDDAIGDGSTIHDAQLDPPNLFLRAERQGGGDGRVYLIVATATHEGASGRACATTVVPKSQSKQHRDDASAQSQAAVQLCEAGGLPSGYHLLVEGALTQPNQAPAVDAGPDQGIELGASAHLEGVVSDDGRPEGGSLTLEWSVVSGPGLVTFTDATRAEAEATFETPGTYVLRLTASDGALSSSDDVQVVVQAANGAPVVDAGPDVVVTLPATTATLRGTVEDDGRLLSSPLVSWTQVGGPGAVVFSQPASPTTEVGLPGDTASSIPLSTVTPLPMGRSSSWTRRRA